jgi:hypothetical protein
MDNNIGKLLADFTINTQATINGLNVFLADVKNNLSEEDKAKLDAEIKKTDWSKIDIELAKAREMLNNLSK